MKGMLNGIIKRKKEDGKVSSMLYMAQVPFTKGDQKADVCLGFKTENVWVGWDVDAKPGDTISVEYEKSSFDGKAIVSDVVVLERRKEN